ncbi:ABC transporter ATP-binding protein [Sulfurivermis fontis]|uniref:ABC transporter ATP-binding protein n=1 Tax=Sulfurivermis fontis TaxID=1972068 RepID=UPI000FD9FB5A|nr:ABC transporter ATP-binding protein [Sulfurivermis fontis]
MIELQGIERVFDVGGQQVHALHNINLRIARGDYVSIMGPSGSGKSTLLNIIGLLDRPSTGRYLFEQHDVTALSDSEQAQVRRERIGFVFQFFHLIPRLTAAENIELPLVLSGVAPAQRHDKVQRTLQAYGLAERARHRPDQLSGGQRQRVAIGRATIIEPALLLADEPTGNLDRASGHEVVEILEQLNARGITLVVVTHDPELGMRARRRLRMVDGAIVEDTGTAS